MQRKKAVKKNPSFVTVSLFLLGLLLILISLSWNIYQKGVLSFAKSPVIAASKVTSHESLPQRILIPKFKIDLPIVESRIKNGVWEINPNGGSHLVGSANPEEAGNIIIYGHNKNDLFGKALALKLNDQIEIISADSTIHNYQIVKKEIVNPTDVDVLAPTTDETLTFYTCTGFLDTKRFVLIAKPI